MSHLSKMLAHFSHREVPPAEDAVHALVRTGDVTSVGTRRQQVGAAPSAATKAASGTEEESVCEQVRERAREFLL